MIILLVQFVVKSGTEAQAREYIRKMEEHTRREPGCRMYIGHQSLGNPHSFCLYEQYDDEAALEVHRKAPYFAEYVTNGLAKLMESRVQDLMQPVE